MALCKQCGKKLPAFTLGPAPELCGACRKSARKHASPSLALRSPTLVLILTNALVFAAMIISGVSPVEPTSAQLLRWGANFGPLTLGTQWWRLFTAMFLHIGIVHIALNMWCLLELGLIAEHLFDPLTFVAAYLLTGVAGSVLSVAWHPTEVGAGASGAIFGVAGLLISLLYVRKVPTQFSIRPKSLLLFVGYNLVLGLRAGVDNAAHVGGLVAGVMLGLALAPQLRADPATDTALSENRERSAHEQRNRYALVATAVLLIAAFALVQRKNDYAVYAWKGVDAAEHQDWSQAERLLHVAVAKRPSDLNVQAQLCYVLEKAQSPEAEACLKREAEISPLSSYPYFELGWFYVRTKRYQEAKQMFDKLRSDTSQSAAAHLGMGAALQGLGDDHGAISEFLVAVQLDPKLIQAYEYMGEAQLHQHEYKDAITSLTQAEKLDPNDPELEDHLGLAYQHAGRREEAQAALQRAAKLRNQAVHH